jgi:LacI family repressor for deo operon, udp, cdd, tsx, nupC, and nupG
MAKIGIKDIAAKAGVSIATVSHAFRNPARVSDATREKVLATAREVGYSPNRLAASLRTSRSGNIVAIIPDIANGFNSAIIKAIEKVAHTNGYSVLLGDTQGMADREREFASMTRSQQADGIVLMSHRVPFDAAANGRWVGLPPMVSACEYSGYDDFPSTGIDDRKAAIDATRHLIDYGHRDIALITGEIETSSSRDRVKGFRDAMSDAGLPVRARLIMTGEYSASWGERATALLLQRKVRPTAIFCFSDEIALGSMFALRQQGFNVPRDMSVMGFDNIQFAAYFAPPLTTVAQPREEIGKLAADLLFDLINGISPARMRHVLEHQLVIRDSTRAL